MLSPSLSVSMSCKVCLGLRHSTEGRRSRSASVQLSGVACWPACGETLSLGFSDILLGMLFYLELCLYIHVCNLSNLLFWLLWECDLNGVQLCGLAPPHPSLAITEPSQDQQTKQNCINLPENLEKKDD